MQWYMILFKGQESSLFDNALDFYLSVVSAVISTVSITVMVLNAIFYLVKIKRYGFINVNS